MFTLDQYIESTLQPDPALVRELSQLTDSDWRPPTHVVVATDGSPRSDAAVVVGRALASRAGEDAELVTVFERPITYEAPLVAKFTDLEIELAAKQAWWRGIEEQRRRLAPYALRWPVTFEEGRPARVLSDTAVTRAKALIVMGSGTHGVVERTVGRELALDVIRDGTAAVLAVHPEETRLPTTAVVALDFTPASIEAAHLALFLLGDHGTLHLVHVREDGTGIGDGFGSSEVPDEETPRFLIEEVQRSLTPSSGVRIERTMLEGDQARAILNFAAEQDADLIACGTHGRSMLERLLVGSVSTRILRSAPCSVLVAPPAQDDPGWR